MQELTAVHCLCRQMLAQMVRYHMLPVALKTDNMTVGAELTTSMSGGKLKVTATSPQVCTSYSDSAMRVSWRPHCEQLQAFVSCKLTATIQLLPVSAQCDL